MSLFCFARRPFATTPRNSTSCSPQQTAVHPMHVSKKRAVANPEPIDVGRPVLVNGKARCTRVTNTEQVRQCMEQQKMSATIRKKGTCNFAKMIGKLCQYHNLVMEEGGFHEVLGVQLAVRLPFAHMQPAHCITPAGDGRAGQY